MSLWHSLVRWIFLLADCVYRRVASEELACVLLQYSKAGRELIVIASKRNRRSKRLRFARKDERLCILLNVNSSHARKDSFSYLALQVAPNCNRRLAAQDFDRFLV